MKPTTPILFLLRFYKRAVSPYLPAVCRFEPSCSAYAMEAYELHGVLRGSLLTLKRLARCQPFSKGGFDPVPPGFHRSH
ncbi:MAG: membrane protein insertion efficiency factor YidD [Acidobacteriota bacterium]|nr:membrane protein insertion efficiency factor YidD [Acidobacteriota bacterium]MDH3783882.1 membrane protein insertion efficiency factor YidD [Acidobacteriota bacterium]